MAIDTVLEPNSLIVLIGKFQLETEPLASIPAPKLLPGVDALAATPSSSSVTSV
jgi:hypothetical protein